jgi:hypothetical protein
MRPFFKYFFISLIFVALLFALFAFLFGSSKSPFYVPKEEVGVKNYTYVCEESWFCTGWSPCIGGFNKRNCIDLYNCGSVENQPELIKSCEVTGTVYYNSSNLYQSKKDPNIDNPSNPSGPETPSSNEKPLQDCVKAIAPICGYAYPSLAMDYDLNNEDCSLKCLGENLFEGCLEGEVYLEGGEGFSALFKILGLKEDTCEVELEIIEDNEYIPGTKGTSLNCDLPINSIPRVYSIVVGKEMEPNDFGSSIVVLFEAMLEEAKSDSSSFCEGTLLGLVPSE